MKIRDENMQGNRNTLGFVHFTDIYIQLDPNYSIIRLFGPELIWRRKTTSKYQLPWALTQRSSATSFLDDFSLGDFVPFHLFQNIIANEWRTNKSNELLTPTFLRGIPPKMPPTARVSSFFKVFFSFFSINFAVKHTHPVSFCELFGPTK